MRTVLVVLGLLVSAAPALAQEAEGKQPEAPQSRELTGLLDSLSVFWADGDAAALAAHGVGAGLDLEVRGQFVGSLHGRRAAAALRQLFAGQETVGVETANAATVVGAEDRAFGELIWEVRMPGAEVTERRKVFVGLVLLDDVWRISQIRILP